VFLEIAFPPVQGHLVEWLTAITLIAGLITALWRWIGLPIRKEWMANKKFQEEFRSDWHGVEARPGVHRDPGRTALRPDRHPGAAAGAGDPHRGQLAGHPADAWRDQHAAFAA
jgi:hypothetical protein